MRILLYILVAALVAVIAVSAYVRLAPVDPADWHVDPDAVTPPSTPNYILLAGSSAASIPAPALAVAGRLQAIAEADGAQLIAGSLGEGFATYMVRTRIMGFPDFITIRLVPEDEATRLHIFARARYGHSDLGTNTARVQRWLTAARDENGGT